MLIIMYTCTIDRFLFVVVMKLLQNRVWKRKGTTVGICITHRLYLTEIINRLKALKTHIQLLPIGSFGSFFFLTSYIGHHCFAPWPCTVQTIAVLQQLLLLHFYWHFQTPHRPSPIHTLQKSVKYMRTQTTLMVRCSIDIGQITPVLPLSNNAILPIPALWQFPVLVNA